MTNCNHKHGLMLTCRHDVDMFTLATLRNRTAVRLTQDGRMTYKMSRKSRNAQSRATFFRHSAVLSLTAVLLRKIGMQNGPTVPVRRERAQVPIGIAVLCS